MIKNVPWSSCKVPLFLSYFNKLKFSLHNFERHSGITRVSQKKTLNIFYFFIWTIWCADPWLIFRCAAISFTVTRRFPFTMASTAAMPSGVTTGCAWPGRGESVTELMPFMNFLVHSYTCCSDRHASPYWTFIRPWISMRFTPSLLKKQTTERCSFWCMLQAVPPFLHYYCAVVLHSCIVLPPVSNSSNHQYHCYQLRRQSSCVSNFYRTFNVFIWLSLVYLMKIHPVWADKSLARPGRKQPTATKLGIY